MKYIKLSKWDNAPETNVYHFYKNCVLHVVSYIVENNLNKQKVVLCVDEKDFIFFSKIHYFDEAIKQFVSDYKVIKQGENINADIVDIHKYRNHRLLEKEIESLDIYKNNLKQANNIVYVRRRVRHENSHTRSINNEQELIDELKKEYGSNVIDVYLENLSFYEQVDLMRGCKLLTGAHGAGFAGMLWMDRGTSILELFPESFFWGTYLTLSYVRGINYNFLHGKDTVFSGITLNQFAKETGLCLHCLRISSPRNHTKHLSEKEFIYSDMEWKLQHSRLFNTILKEKKFEINKDEFLKKIKEAYR